MQFLNMWHPEMWCLDICYLDGWYLDSSLEGQVGRRATFLKEFFWLTNGDQHIFLGQGVGFDVIVRRCDVFVVLEQEV